MTREILRLPDVLEMIGVGRRTLYRWSRNGDFPAPIQLGPNSIGWRRADVEEWIESRPTATAAVV